VAYLKALPRVFGYPLRARNFGVLLGAWAVIAVGFIGAGFLVASGSVRATCLGLIVFVMAEGTFAALCFNTVHQTADGQDDLPGIPLFGSIAEWWPGAIVPFLGMLLTYVIAMGPAIAYAIYAINSAPTGQDPGTPDTVALLALLALGLFLWPMLVLALTMGDFKALLRIDAMVLTAAQTFPAYVVALLLVYGCAAILVVMDAVLSDSDSSSVALAALLLGIRAYVQIAAMRAVGVYYYCYQSRFAWL